MLSQPDFVSQDVGIVVNLWWVFEVKCCLPPMGHLILLGEADKIILQRVILMRQPLNWDLREIAK